ncbi:MAG: ThuA domain-containing protein [Phycisphaerales bacterium]|jgi:type 1 glutamine amidotransferase|nr:ThuA domain-containing protein [Phycisphaerales bacterium]
MLKKIVIVSLLAVVVAGVFAGAASAAVKPENVAKMTKAMPDKAPAKPAKARKVLIYSHCNGFTHRAGIEAAKVALPMMGKKTGAYEAVVSDDLDNFTPEKIKQFDAIILNNTTGELFKAKGPRKPRKPNAKRIKDADKLKKAMEKYTKDLASYEAKVKATAGKGPDTEALRKSFMDWVNAGGAVIGIHAATDCSYSWKEYGKMIGGFFAGHPWHMPVPIKNDDPKNPINAAFEGKGFTITDEIYQFNRGVYSRENQRVILSLDMDTIKKKGGSRKDNDYAISWVKTHGKGRVFYCSLGHRDEIFWNPLVLKHYLAGMQWAMGDLKDVCITPNPLKK